MRERIALLTYVSNAVAALASTAVLSQSPVASTEELYEQERWFELRERLRGSNETSPLITGTVASAFNEVAAAERLLTEAIRIAPTVTAANEARGKLTMLYLRLGRSSDAGREIDAVLKTEPRSDIQTYAQSLVRTRIGRTSK